jgi:hypothetical protein
MMEIDEIRVSHLPRIVDPHGNLTSAQSGQYAICDQNSHFPFDAGGKTRDGCFAVPSRVSSENTLMMYCLTSKRSVSFVNLAIGGSISLVQT